MKPEQENEINCINGNDYIPASSVLISCDYCYFGCICKILHPGCNSDQTKEEELPETEGNESTQDLETTTTEKTKIPKDSSLPHPDMTGSTQRKQKKKSARMKCKKTLIKLDSVIPKIGKG